MKAHKYVENMKVEDLEIDSLKTRVWIIRKNFIYGVTELKSMEETHGTISSCLSEHDWIYVLKDLSGHFVESVGERPYWRQKD